jgi:Holliday junction resolvase RusA-like endonuclease
LITLSLPIPPSVNDLFDGGRRTRRRFKSDRYKAWEDEADGCLYQQKQGVVVGAYVVEIGLPEMMRGDVDNRIKPVLDFLVSRGLTPDDKHLRKLSIERSEAVEPGWCHVTARAA